MLPQRGVNNGIKQVLKKILEVSNVLPAIYRRPIQDVVRQAMNIVNKQEEKEKTC